MKLKREQVMAALECWTSHKPCDKDCPLIEYEGSQSCLALTIENSLALILELTDEVAKAKADTVRKMEIKLQMHFGTYTPDDTIKVDDVFKLLGKFKEEILEEST